ncbi:MAG TPA: hypothetical protein VFM79_09560, partial [Pelobium sp.]|nr:hypothetical protein [Pelobium sp.]
VEEEKTEVIKEETSAEEKLVIAKPAGFKPRFKAGQTTSTPKVEEEKPEISKEETPVVTKPAGFKPRFKTPKKEE